MVVSQNHVSIQVNGKILVGDGHGSFAEPALIILKIHIENVLDVSGFVTIVCPITRNVRRQIHCNVPHGRKATLVKKHAVLVNSRLRG